MSIPGSTLNHRDLGRFGATVHRVVENTFQLGLQLHSLYWPPFVIQQPNDPDSPGVRTGSRPRVVTRPTPLSIDSRSLIPVNMSFSRSRAPPNVFATSQSKAASPVSARGSPGKAVSTPNKTSSATPKQVTPASPFKVPPGKQSPRNVSQAPVKASQPSPASKASPAKTPSKASPATPTTKPSSISAVNKVPVKPVKKADWIASAGKHPQTATSAKASTAPGPLAAPNLAAGTETSAVPVDEPATTDAPTTADEPATADEPDTADGSTTVDAPATADAQSTANTLSTANAPAAVQGNPTALPSLPGTAALDKLSMADLVARIAHHQQGATLHTQHALRKIGAAVIANSHTTTAAVGVLCKL